MQPSTVQYGDFFFFTEFTEQLLSCILAVSSNQLLHHETQSHLVFSSVFSSVTLSLGILVKGKQVKYVFADAVQ